MTKDIEDIYSAKLDLQGADRKSEDPFVGWETEVIHKMHWMMQWSPASTFGHRKDVPGAYVADYEKKYIG